LALTSRVGAQESTPLRELKKNGRSQMVEVAAPASFRLERSLHETLRADPAVSAGIKRVMVEALDATKSHWCMATKRWVEEPDHKIRLDAAKFAAAYLEGLPTQTVVTASAGGESLPRLADVLMKLPSARAAMQTLLDRLGPPPAPPSGGPVVDV
jgi:hypothetical protein